VPEVPETVKDHVAWLEVCELDELGEGLTQWEIDFVESLRSQLLEQRLLSKPQLRRLEEIREERL
tara:strand:- start:236 stop:430 length:195 start_codon:yes stop_codon:yes gene_type:complete